MRLNITSCLIAVVLFFLAACGNDSTQDKTPAPPPPAPPSADTVAAAPAAPPTSSGPAAPAAEPAPAVKGTLPKTNSPIDSAMSSKTPPTKPGKPKPAPKPPTVKSNPKGYSTGYISRKDISLQSEPKAQAAKTRSFKLYEGVIILESKMTDEAGKPTDIPTWYKVECVDKKMGWVEARSITLN